MSPTTILLADLPPIFEDMMTSVLQLRPDLRLVRGAPGERNLLGAALAAGAQVVVVARRDPTDLGATDPLLAAAANLSVVALASDGTSACLHSLTPESRRIDDVSAEQILAAIAGAAPARHA